LDFYSAFLYAEDYGFLAFYHGSHETCPNPFYQNHGQNTNAPHSYDFSGGSGFCFHYGHSNAYYFFQIIASSNL
jgi:hypothetical protein